MPQVLRNPFLYAFLAFVVLWLLECRINAALVDHNEALKRIVQIRAVDIYAEPSGSQRCNP